MTTPKRNEAVAPVPNFDDVMANIKPAAFVVRGPDHSPFQAVTLTEHEDITAALRRQRDALQGEVSRLREREAELSAFVLTLWDEYTSAAEYMGEGCLGVDPYRKAQLDALNLEPPTDGR